MADENRKHQVVVRLTTEEWSALRLAAARSRTAGGHMGTFLYQLARARLRKLVTEKAPAT